MPPYVPFPFPAFSAGLQLKDQPTGVRQDEAIDLLNVRFTERGAVEQRPGYAEYTTSELTNRGDSCAPFYKTDGTRQLLVGAGTRLEAINTSGAVVASATGLTSGPWNFVRFGAPNTEVAYAGNGTDTLRKWTGSAWSAPTAYVDSVSGRALPKAKCLVVDNDSNRLVATGFDTTTGGPNGATTSPSHVYWSEPGQVEGDASNNAWNTANSAQLRPGDGEEIMGAAAYQGQIFIFKQSVFWRFWGESVDSAGIVDFEDSRIEGVGLDAPLAVCAGRDGVYFMSREGVYRTTGGPAELVSDAVEPIFTGEPSIYFQSSGLNDAAIDKCWLAWHEEQLYLGYPSGAATTCDRVLVYDPRQRWWSLYDIAAAAAASFRIGDDHELVFPYAAGEKHLGRHGDPDFVKDDMEPAATGGTAVTSRWQSGWFDFGFPMQKVVRETKLFGQGSLEFSTYVDFRLAPQLTESVDLSSQADLWADGTNAADLWGDGDGSDLWGPAGVIAPQTVGRTGVRGTVFSIKFASNTSGEAWAIHRATPHMLGTRNITIEQTEAA